MSYLPCDACKLVRVTLVTKLRAFLLMEGNFNATNKIVYGSRMIQTARGHHLILEEIFSEKNRLPNDGTPCITFFYNITRQARVPAAIASVDASNCYDRWIIFLEETPMPSWTN